MTVAQASSPERRSAHLCRNLLAGPTSGLKVGGPGPSIRKLAPSPSRSPAVLLVTNPSQLPVALSQYEKPVVINNTPANAWLTYWFKQLLRLENIDKLLFVAWLIVRLITQSYNLEPHWYIKFGWIEVGGKITLTPRTGPPPAGEE